MALPASVIMRLHVPVETTTIIWRPGYWLPIYIILFFIQWRFIWAIVKRGYTDFKTLRDQK